MRLPNRSSCFLKGPDILHDVGAHFLFDLITNYVAWIRRGNGQYFRLEVRHELAVLHPKQRCLHGILVFHFVVFALRRDAPTMNAVDLRFRVEICECQSVLSAVWTKNLERAPLGALDLSISLHA